MAEVLAEKYLLQSASDVQVDACNPADSDSDEEDPKEMEDMMHVMMDEEEASSDSDGEPDLAKVLHPQEESDSDEDENAKAMADLMHIQESSDSDDEEKEVKSLGDLMHKHIQDEDLDTSEDDHDEEENAELQLKGKSIQKWGGWNSSVCK